MTYALAYVVTGQPCLTKCWVFTSSHFLKVYLGFFRVSVATELYFLTPDNSALWQCELLTALTVLVDSVTEFTLYGKV